MNYSLHSFYLNKLKTEEKSYFFQMRGIVQRIFILAYISNNINLKQIEKYFKYISQGKILINLISSSKKSIMKSQKDTKIKKAGLLIKSNSKNEKN